MSYYGTAVQYTQDKNEKPNLFNLAGGEAQG